jgi:hypothetical protein
MSNMLTKHGTRQTLARKYLGPVRALFGAHDGPLQTFECRTRRYEVDRSADRSGLPHLSDAAVLPQHRLD